jgi:Domain of unknown function (DUF1835)
LSDRPQDTRASETQRRAAPFRLNLEQQRKRAKELLKAARYGEPDALRRFGADHPHATGSCGTALSDHLARLSEAQLVVARELGLPSWPRLRAHIQAMDRARESIGRGDVVPDQGLTTLHIRCGSDIESALKEAGFVGDFLEYADPLCQGPVLDEAAWLERRAAFVAESCGAVMGQSRQQIAEKLVLAERRLQSAAERYQRIVLWFEHDTYDQLILARCLAHFAERPPRRLELISLAHYPGGVRFIGLGQLPPEALRLLWGDRVPVSDGSLRAGQSVWSMLRSPDPRPLADLARMGIAELPQLAGAVRRHCQELPWIGTGLSLTERLILQLLAEAPRTVGQTFHQLMMEREPLPWLSDLLFRFIVENIKRVEQPMFTAAFDGGDHQPWPQERLTITPLGRAVLAGTVDWLSLRPPARWLGGVLIPRAGPCWRWDASTASAVRC